MNSPAEAFLTVNFRPKTSRNSYTSYNIHHISSFSNDFQHFHAIFQWIFHGFLDGTSLPQPIPSAMEAGQWREILALATAMGGRGITPAFHDLQCGAEGGFSPMFTRDFRHFMSYELL